MRIAGDRTCTGNGHLPNTSLYGCCEANRDAVGGVWEGRLGDLDGLEFAILYQCDTYAELHFMQVGALSQFAFTVCAWSDNHFLDLWIGRVGPKDWLPCDFLHWTLTDGKSTY